MVPLYLFCLIVGAGLLLVSLFAGDTGEGDADLPPDVGTLAQDFFSARALVYLLAGFGATGLLLELLTDAGPREALAWAAAAGAAAAASAALLYGWLRRGEVGVLPLEADHLTGLAARVLLPLEGARRGKVVARQGDREIELLARLYGPADPACLRGSTVVIVAMDGETALVTPAALLSPDAE